MQVHFRQAVHTWGAVGCSAVWTNSLMRSAATKCSVYKKSASLLTDIQGDERSDDQLCLAVKLMDISEQTVLSDI